MECENIVIHAVTYDAEGRIISNMITFSRCLMTFSSPPMTNW